MLLHGDEGPWGHPLAPSSFQAAIDSNKVSPHAYMAIKGTGHATIPRMEKDDNKHLCYFQSPDDVPLGGFSPSPPVEGL